MDDLLGIRSDDLTEDAAMMLAAAGLDDDLIGLTDEDLG